MAAAAPPPPYPISRAYSNASTVSASTIPGSMPDSPMTVASNAPVRTLPSAMSAQAARMLVKSVTLTSKKNWWMVELDGPDEPPREPVNSINSISTDETPAEPEYKHHHHHGRPPTPRTTDVRMGTTSASTQATPSVFRPPQNPASIFSFPTPTSYSAPGVGTDPTASLEPCAHGSASELFKCVVKKPDVVQMELNGEMQSNAVDVTVQFLAELRVYTTVTRHRNICAFLGSLENVGMVLEYIDGRTLYDVICEVSEKSDSGLTTTKKVDFHNQLLDGLTHLHSYGLSHGDLSLLNVQVTIRNDTIKLLDFGRSVSADSVYLSPDDEPPYAQPHFYANGERKVEQIHPGTRPFCAPEILRGECEDALLADAYSFGMILVCLDRCQSVDVKIWDQKKDKLPPTFFDGCELFEERARAYLRKWSDGRRRLLHEDMMML